MTAMRIPTVGDRVTLTSSSDVWIVDQVLQNPDQAALRLNGLPSHVKTVPWGVLIYQGRRQVVDLPDAKPPE